VRRCAWRRPGGRGRRGREVGRVGGAGEGGGGSEGWRAEGGAPEDEGADGKGSGEGWRAGEEEKRAGTAAEGDAEEQAEKVMPTPRRCSALRACAPPAPPKAPARRRREGCCSVGVGFGGGPRWGESAARCSGRSVGRYEGGSTDLGCGAWRGSASIWDYAGAWRTREMGNRRAGWWEEKRSVGWVGVRLPN
jgi:hypothetical protein